MIDQPTPPKGTVSAGFGGQRWRVAGLCLVLAAITFAVFAQTVKFKFVNYDDPDYVIENPHVTQGLATKDIAWAFTHFYSSNWHPLTWISHMLDCELYGLQPGGHHLTNVLFHTATVIALFLILRQMTGALWRSAFVAAVFAIHPLRVESVAWIAERKDVLSGFFFILTIGAYAGYVRHARSLARYGLVLLLFVLGLLSKPMLVTLPLILLLLDYWPLQRKEPVGKLILEKLPLLALSALSCRLTLSAQRGAMKSTDLFPILHRIVNAVLTCKVYLVQMVYPAGLIVFYPFPRKGLPGIEAAMAAGLMGVVSFVAWSNRQTRPWLLVGWVWYFVMLFPVLGIVQVGAQAHADRYTYLPQIGIYVALTWLAAEWAAKQRIPQAVWGVLMSAVVAVLMICAWQQARYWKDSESLWTHALVCVPDNKVAFLNLGNHLFRKDRLDEAVVLFKKAVETDPNYADFHNNLGKAYDDKGDLDAAIPEYKEAVMDKAAFPEAEYNLGKALNKTGKVDEAILHLKNSIQIQPTFAPAHMSLGNALLQHGEASEAAVQFEQMLEYKPNDAGAHLNLGLCLFQMGQIRPAMEQYQKALELDPANPGIQNNYAWLLATCRDASLRNGNEAVDLARQANKRSGGENPVILRTLAAALAEAGRFSEAVQTAEQASLVAQAQHQGTLTGQLQSELKLYKAGQPFHEPGETVK